MTELSPARIRDFLLTRYSAQITGAGFDPATLPDEFDFLLNGVIDSFGVLEMVGAIEDEFGVSLDLETLDAEQITVLGPLANFVAQHASAR